MNFVTVFFLTTAITVSTTRLPAGNYEDALKAAGKATYIQTGTDKVVNNLEKRYEPAFVKEYEKYEGWIVGIMKVTTEQKISLEWTF